jgi:hypothetical protein
MSTLIVKAVLGNMLCIQLIIHKPDLNLFSALFLLHFTLCMMLILRCLVIWFVSVLRSDVDDSDEAIYENSEILSPEIQLDDPFR